MLAHMISAVYQRISGSRFGDPRHDAGRSLTMMGVLSKIFSKNGLLYCWNIAVRILPYRDQYWRVNGKLHLVDGPAYIGADGTEVWLQDGNLHRLDGPAYIGADGYHAWLQNGVLHRLDGPAWIGADGDQAWWVNDRDISTEVAEWMTRMEIPPYDEWTDVEKTLFRMIASSL